MASKHQNAKPRGADRGNQEDHEDGKTFQDGSVDARPSNDEPPPRYAHAWRSKRLGALAKAKAKQSAAERERYEQAMAESRRA